jgi:hypothetical protein
MARPALVALVIAARRRWLGLAASFGIGGAFAGAPAAPSRLQALPAPEALKRLLAAPDSGWLALGVSGRLWALAADAPPRMLADGLDADGPLATGHGRIVARRADGRLWVGGGAADAGVSDAPIAAVGGLRVLPFAVIAIEGTGLNARVLRLEPSAGGRWQAVARSADTVLPDAQPLQVDLDGRGDGGQLLVLGGPDEARYRHAVLGDGIEATRVLLLERHSLQPLRALELPAPLVLEDIAPRLWHSGGRPGLVSMLSDAQGARLVLIEADPARADRLALVAQGEAIGTRNRWMAASTDGQRLVAVHMPHLSGVLTAYRRSGDRLIGRSLGQGLSNHAIGTRELDVSAWLDGRFVVPDAATRRLRRFDVDAAVELEPIDLPQPLRQIVAERAVARLGLLGTDGRAWQLAGK